VEVGVVVGDGVEVGVVVGDGVEVGVGVGVGVGVVLQVVGTLMVLPSRLTSAVWANTRPTTVAPVFSETESAAKIVPTKAVVEPNVASLPTCQNTLHAEAMFSRTTELADAVVKLDDPVWKMNTELGLSCPFRVSVPVRPSPVLSKYTPAVRVCPPRSVDTVAVLVSPAATTYALVRSLLACTATGSSTNEVPMTVGEPVTELPGLRPRSPVMTEVPVLVTVVPAKTAKGAAVARFTVVAASAVTPPRATQMVTAPSPRTAADQRGRRPISPLEWSV
jgi:hypothetical protein